MKNKKPLIALIALLLIGVVGVTFAYFTNSKTFSNIFQISDGGYATLIEESFEAPDNWLPGQEVQKEVYVTNTGNIPIVARVKYTETWSGDLDGKLEDDSAVAIINFADNNDWVLHTDGYYYYNAVVAKGTKTTSFIKSVTLNPELQLDSEYMNTSYTLDIVVETIQADGASDEWGIDSTIVEGL